MSRRPILRYLPAMVRGALNRGRNEPFDASVGSSDEIVLRQLRHNRREVPEWCSVISHMGKTILLVNPKDAELEYEGAHEIKRSFDWAIRNKGDVILDLTQTPYLDSSGLGLILALSKQVRTQFRMILIAPKDQTVHNILVLTRLESIFLRVETYEDALKALAHLSPAP